MEPEPTPPMTVQPMPTISPSPVPTTFSVGQVGSGNGDMLAQLQVTTPTGTHVVFLDPNSAKAVGQALMRVAEMSASGLLMP